MAWWAWGRTAGWSGPAPPGQTGHAAFCMDFRGQLDPFNHRLESVVLLVRQLDGALQVVQHRQELCRELLQCKLVGFLHVLSGTATQVLHLGDGANGAPALFQEARWASSWASSSAMRACSAVTSLSTSVGSTGWASTCPSLQPFVLRGSRHLQYSGLRVGGWRSDKRHAPADPVLALLWGHSPGFQGKKGEGAQWRPSACQAALFGADCTNRHGGRQIPGKARYTPKTLPDPITYGFSVQTVALIGKPHHEGPPDPDRPVSVPDQPWLSRAAGEPGGPYPGGCSGRT